MRFNIEKEIEKAINQKVGGKKKEYPVLSECPVCQHDLMVSKLSCGHCGTEIQGNYILSKFNYLDSEKLYFIEVFVKNRGNIKAIEKEMGYSYPTIKKMLDEVITELGYKLESKDLEGDYNKEEKISKIDILNKIDNGEMSVEEAAKSLAKL